MLLTIFIEREIYVKSVRMPNLNCAINNIAVQYYVVPVIKDPSISRLPSILRPATSDTAPIFLM